MLSRIMKLALPALAVVLLSACIFVVKSDVVVSPSVARVSAFDGGSEEPLALARGFHEQLDK